MSFTTKLFVAMFGIGISWIGSSDAQACDGGGRRVVYVRPRPVCHYPQQHSVDPHQYQQYPETTTRRTVARQTSVVGGQVMTHQGMGQPGVIGQSGASGQARMAGKPGITGQSGTPGQSGLAQSGRAAQTGNQGQPRLNAAQGAPASPVAEDTAAMSALQALGGFEGRSEGGQAVEASTQSQNVHIGNWTATLGNGATVQLALDAGGSFNWVAVKDGKTSNFQGSYTLENGTLTLIRSDASQQLAGTMTLAGDSFNFKLNGAKDDAGLSFVRG